MQHGPFTQLATQYWKPPQEQQYLVGTCCLTSPSLLTGPKLETTGNTRQTLTRNVKITHTMIGTTELVAKYFSEKMVHSAIRESVWMWSLNYHISSYEWDNRGSTWNKIRTTEYQESNTFFNIRLNSHKCYYFYGSSPSPTQHLCFTSSHDDTSWHS